MEALTAKLRYENEIELLGLGDASYYWRRRTDALIAGTPHEMPVPAKELGVKGEALYTWGGTGPLNSVTPPKALPERGLRGGRVIVFRPLSPFSRLKFFSLPQCSGGGMPEECERARL